MKPRWAIVFAWLLACVGVSSLEAQLRTRVQAAEFINPTAFVPDPTDRDTQFVVQQDGRILSVKAGVTRSALLDLRAEVVSGGEQGLLGLAFPPGAPERLFVNFTNRAGNTVVARFRRSNDAPGADAGTRFDLRLGSSVTGAYIEQPVQNHNRGHLSFGPEECPHHGIGDGQY